VIALLGQIIRVRRRDTELLFTVSVIVLGVVVMAVISSVFLSALTRFCAACTPNTGGWSRAMSG